MKKLVLAIFILATCIVAHGQQGFELNVSTKLGYYFPANTERHPADLFVSNAFSPAAGISLGYNFFKSTGVFLGVEYAHLSPDKEDLFSGENLDVKWQSVNIPLNVQQGIWRNFYLTAGVTLVRQIKGYYDGVSTFSQQKIPEYNWQAGAGYKLNDLRISVQYSRGFSDIDKRIKTSATSSSGVTVRHREIFMKLEYPLWKF
ncbi:MAG: porin family protein [Mariniphaga sp.]|nr:porin family protein [Mariniphaga sp.]